MSKIVKCPECKGKGEYDVIQNWEGKEITTPVKCHCENGKITWLEFCQVYRNKGRSLKNEK